MPINPVEQIGYSDEYLDRYSRHLLLNEVGLAGQRKLAESSVFMVGAGGLGSAALLYLSAAGVGRIGIADSDRLEISNLHRQVIHSHGDLGIEKARSAQQAIRRLNPECNVDVFPRRLTAENIGTIIKGYDVVLDGSDNFPTRMLVTDYCWFEKIPLVSAAVVRFEGQLMSILPQKGCPCYRCLIPELPDQVPACVDVGVLGPAVGVMGTLQAVETVKLLLEIGRPLTCHLLIYNALVGEFRNVHRPVDPQCPLCGPNPTIKTLVQYGDCCRGGANNGLSSQL